MLAHKVDGKNSTGYSDLLLAAQKLEWWAEARDPLLPKTTTTGGLNATYSQTPGSLFPSTKLKGSCAFTTQSATVESNEAKEALDMKPEREEEAKSSAGEDVETSSGVGGADQSVGYIVHFANTVKLNQRKNQNCFSSPDHLMKDCLRDLSRTTQKESLNAKGGNENYINNSLETLVWQNRKSPLVGVEPNASHLLDECPRLLDHRGFLICPRSLIQVIHACPLLWPTMVGGKMKKGGWAPQKPVVTQPASPDKAPQAWGLLKMFHSYTPIHWLIGVDLRT